SSGSGSIAIVANDHCILCILNIDGPVDTKFARLRDRSTNQIAKNFVER
ncbi:33324_t:CDS:2, partial [Racocetra persica]